MKVSELLDCEAKWTRERYARDKAGYSVPDTSPDACQWCLVGALGKCYPDSFGFVQAHEKLQDAITKYMGGYVEITSFNDRKKTTFEDVKKVVEMAGI